MKKCFPNNRKVNEQIRGEYAWKTMSEMFLKQFLDTQIPTPQCPSPPLRKSLWPPDVSMHSVICVRHVSVMNNTSNSRFSSSAMKSCILTSLRMLCKFFVMTCNVIARRAPIEVPTGDAPSRGGLVFCKHCCAASFTTSENDEMPSLSVDFPRASCLLFPCPYSMLAMNSSNAVFTSAGVTFSSCQSKSISSFTLASGGNLEPTRTTTLNIL